MRALCLVLVCLFALAPSAKSWPGDADALRWEIKAPELTFTTARRSIRSYLASPLVSRIRVLRCKRKAWNHAILCHVTWVQGGVAFNQHGRSVPLDVEAWAWARVFGLHYQCSVAGAPWGPCANARVF